MIVLCSYTGFILLSSSIITIYVYLGFDYWQDQNSFTQDKWSDNGARNKFQVCSQGQRFWFACIGCS